MRRDRAARGKITTRRRDVRAPCPREQRPQQQHRPAQAADERAVGRIRLCILRPNAERRRADAVHFGTEIQQQSRHHLDVADARHVGEHAFVFGQQAGREQRQRGVLVPLDRDAAAETVAAFNEQR